MGRKEAVYGSGTVGCVVGMLRQAIYRFLPLSAILVWDGGRSSRRKGIFPEYKSGRGIPTDEQVQGRWLDTARVVRVARRLGCRSLLLPGKEADDVIGVIASKCLQPIIVSSDEDFLQLVDRGASCWLLDKDKFVSKTNFQGEYSVLPGQFLLYKAVVGDPGDGIPGVSGVGPKTIASLLSFDRSVSTFEELCKVIRKMNTTKRTQSILESGSLVARNLNLMDIQRELFSVDELALIETCVTGSVAFEEDVSEDILNLGMKIPIQVWSDWGSVFRRLV